MHTRITPDRFCIQRKSQQLHTEQQTLVNFVHHHHYHQQFTDNLSAQAQIESTLV